MTLRTLEELIDKIDPGFPLLREWADAIPENGVSLLPRDAEEANAALLHLQVTTRSMLGAVVYETGGITVRDGFLRILGSGSERSLRNTNTAIGLMTDGDRRATLIADDVLGGLFALNGGGLSPEGLGDVFHLAADDSYWTSLEVGYSDFLNWCLTGDLMAIYEPLATLPVFNCRPCPAFDATYSFYPLLWSEEARTAEPTCSIVPVDESIRLRFELSGFATA